MHEPSEPRSGAIHRTPVLAANGAPGERPARVLRVRRTHVTAVLGVALAAVLVWARGRPAFVAWELAWDHDRDFGRRALHARIWNSEPGDVGAWLESHGTPVPPLPERRGELELVGARYCALFDRIAAHVYYAGEGRRVSAFVLSGPVRIGSGWAGRARGHYVRLLRCAGRVVAVVGDRPSDVEALSEAFVTTVARRMRAPLDAHSLAG
jgi:hypothetical protein